MPGSTGSQVMSTLNYSYLDLWVQIDERKKMLAYYFKISQNCNLNFKRFVFAVKLS